MFWMSFSDNPGTNFDVTNVIIYVPDSILGVIWVVLDSVIDILDCVGTFPIVSLTYLMVSFMFLRVPLMFLMVSSMFLMGVLDIPDGVLDFHVAIFDVLDRVL